MQKKFNGARFVKSHHWEFPADAGTVFMLLCPTKELDWIKGWEEMHELIYSASGIAEDACVFTTRIPPEGYSVWLTSQYSRENTYIEFVKHLVEKEVVIRWRMDVKPLTVNTCAVFIRSNITGLSEAGNQFSQFFNETGFSELMNHLEALIRHYLATGQAKEITPPDKE